MQTVKDIREKFKQLLADEKFVGFDREQAIMGLMGNTTIELLGESFIADEEAIFGEVNWDYVKREVQWYMSQSLNVNDIPGGPPPVWKSVASNTGEINSNYGAAIFSKENCNQYAHVRDELLRNPGSRRGTMIYTRPSMWYDYNRDGMSDFMCTNAVTYIIRDHLVHANVQMRSNDCIFGYRNDRAWQLHVLKMLVDDLNGRRKSSHQAEVVKVTEENKYRQQQRQSISLGMSGGMSGGTILKIEDLPPPDPFIPYTVGNLYWNVTSLHVYARHLKLVDPNYQGTT